MYTRYNMLEHSENNFCLFLVVYFKNEKYQEAKVPPEYFSYLYTNQFTAEKNVLTDFEFYVM